MPTTNKKYKLRGPHLKLVVVPAPIHQKLRAFCDEHGLIMGRFVAKAIEKAIAQATAC